MIIKLTEGEIKKAKYISDRWDTTTGKFNITKDQLKENVKRDTSNGVKYEMVLAKYLEIPYDGDIGKPGEHDVGGKYEVRGTKYESGHLILYPEDKDAPFILVTGEGNTFRIAGWIMSEDGKKKEYWREDLRAPCYFVPQSKLKNIETLSDMMEEGDA